MKKILFTGLITLVAVTKLFADIPYTFTPHTPAKASEVNANFQALKNMIQENNRSIVQNTQSIQNSNCYKSVFSYTYNHISSNIGDTVTVGNVQYIIVAMPFVEFKTGDRYYIKYPAKKTTNSNKNISLYTSIDTYYYQDTTLCHLETFLGFPAKYGDIYYDHSYRAIVDDPVKNHDKFVLEASASQSISLKINQTRITIGFYLRKELQSTPLSAGDVDLRDNIDWSKTSINTAMVDDVRTLMNYVEIVKIP